MRYNTRTRTLIAFVLAACLLSLPLTAFAKKGEKNFKRGMQYELSQQWDKAAQEFTLAVAADPSNMEYQLHFRRASFNASQTYMQQGRSLAERGDFVGAYNAFRQAYGYDPVNELAVSEMERMLRLQAVKEGRTPGSGNGNGNGNGAKNGTGEPEAGTTGANGQAQDFTPREQQLRIINYNGDLKTLIRSLADQLSLNVIFDRQSFTQSRPIDINLKDVTTAQALDYVFLQEGLFFQKLSRRTILVADQARRPQYQQLVLRTFFLSNMKPNDARTLVQQAIPPSVGRPQTIVVPDEATNSLTVRDTAENVRLIGDLLQSIDKDRAEVVMDVNIYEVSKNDLLTFGNQINATLDNGLGGSPGFSLLTDNGVLSSAARGVSLAGQVSGVPTALAAALVIPPSVLRAFQSKDNTKLIASTQVHAFNGEESTARIGQRVPVQTAQAYPFGVQTGTPQTGVPGIGNPFPTGGFPVINYEPTGLTLKFTPQVFPNLDVQVKMNIEQKDVLGASTLTPTFTERTMTGTARVQNNRTMMLASISTDVETRGRRGIAFISGLPFIGRLFTAPTRDLRQVDIVISVTPRVLRAPNVTPRDEEMRPSGTLQSPTTGLLADMMRETEREEHIADVIRNAQREEQIAAARSLPTHATIQLPDAPLEVAKAVEPTLNAPRPIGNNNAATTTQPTTTNTTAPATVTAPGPAAPTQTQPEAKAPPIQTQTQVQAPSTQAQNNKPAVTMEELPSFVPAPKSLVSEKAASDVAAVNPSAAGAQNAVLTSAPKATETSLDTKLNSKRVAQLSFEPTGDVLKVGEKRRYAIQLNSEVPLSLALLALRFDPKVVKVHALTAGTLIGTSTEAAPIFTPSIDASGVCLISISSLNGKISFGGSGPLLFIDIEAIGAGDASLVFDKERMHLVAADAKDVVSEILQGTATVKQ
ncbi:MAG TPA: secretin N-terminal domain-containing protein [Pyrinomonadaceae bacterium]|nr:secretin N-terminal domain-containing protein [Pyrinomonadaceae bacterium]